jgi:hypothetical protein
MVLAESRREDQVRAGESGKNGAEVDAQVRGGPERIPPDRGVPRNVPVQSDGGGCHGDRRTPDIPRYLSYSI